jgi:hypothetical protein
MNNIEKFLDHYEICKTLNLADFESGSLGSGTKINNKKDQKVII